MVWGGKLGAGWGGFGDSLTGGVAWKGMAERGGDGLRLVAEALYGAQAPLTFNQHTYTVSLLPDTSPPPHLHLLWQLIHIEQRLMGCQMLDVALRLQSRRCWSRGAGGPVRQGVRAGGTVCISKPRGAVPAPLPPLGAA